LDWQRLERIHLPLLSLESRAVSPEQVLGGAHALLHRWPALGQPHPYGAANYAGLTANISLQAGVGEDPRSDTRHAAVGDARGTNLGVRVVCVSVVHTIGF
jgi:hypothetical protein